MHPVCLSLRSEPLVQGGCHAWALVLREGRPDRRAGLLASGSSYCLRLPIPLKRDSGMLQGSSPVTAAGPRRLFRLPY